MASLAGPTPETVEQAEANLNALAEKMAELASDLREQADIYGRILVQTYAEGIRAANEPADEILAKEEIRATLVGFGAIVGHLNVTPVLASRLAARMKTARSYRDDARAHAKSESAKAARR